MSWPPAVRAGHGLEIGPPQQGRVQPGAPGGRGPRLAQRAAAGRRVVQRLHLRRAGHLPRAAAGHPDLLVSHGRLDRRARRRRRAPRTASGRAPSKPSWSLMAIMCSLPSAFPVMIRVSCGSRAASRSSMASLSSRPRRCPRCGPATAVSSWNPHSGHGRIDAHLGQRGQVAGGRRARRDHVGAQSHGRDPALVQPDPGHVPGLRLLAGLRGARRPSPRRGRRPRRPVLGRGPSQAQQGVSAGRAVGLRPQRRPLLRGQAVQGEHPADRGH